MPKEDTDPVVRCLIELKREHDAFEANRKRWHRKYRGRWVAVLGGEVVDSDPDRARLEKRLATDRPDASVFVTRA